MRILKIDDHYSTYIKNLYKTKVGFGETFAEHQKSCEDGCVLCVGLRKKIDAQKEKESQPIAGVSGARVQELRRQMHLQDRISHYFPSRTDIRDEHGALRKDVYLVLQSNGFADRQIRLYFGINNHEWQDFKKREFPKWTTNKNDLLAEEGFEAQQRFSKERNARTSKYGVGYFDKVDAKNKNKV